MISTYKSSEIILMHYLADSFSTPQKGFTNPEEKVDNNAS